MSSSEVFIKLKSLDHLRNIALLTLAASFKISSSLLVFSSNCQMQCFAARLRATWRRKFQTFQYFDNVHLSSLGVKTHGKLEDGHVPDATVQAVSAIFCAVLQEFERLDSIFSH